MSQSSGGGGGSMDHSNSNSNSRAEAAAAGSAEAAAAGSAFPRGISAGSNRTLNLGRAQDWGGAGSNSSSGEEAAAAAPPPAASRKRKVANLAAAAAVAEEAAAEEAAALVGRRRTGTRATAKAALTGRGRAAAIEEVIPPRRSTRVTARTRGSRAAAGADSDDEEGVAREDVEATANQEDLDLLPEGRIAQPSAAQIEELQAAKAAAATAQAELKALRDAAQAQAEAASKTVSAKASAVVLYVPRRVHAYGSTLMGWATAPRAARTVLTILQAAPATPEDTFRYTPAPAVSAAVASVPEARIYNAVSTGYQHALYDVMSAYVALQAAYNNHTAVFRDAAAEVSRRQQADNFVYAAECEFIKAYYVFVYLAREKLVSHRIMAAKLLSGTAANRPKQIRLMQTPSLTGEVGVFRVAPIVRITSRELMGLNEIARTIFEDAFTPGTTAANATLERLITDGTGSALYAGCSAELVEIRKSVLEIPEGGWPRLNDAPVRGAVDLLQATGAFDMLNAAAGGRYTDGNALRSRQTIPERVRELGIVGTARAALSAAGSAVSAAGSAAGSAASALGRFAGSTVSAAGAAGRYAGAAGSLLASGLSAAGSFALEMLRAWSAYPPGTDPSYVSGGGVMVGLPQENYAVMMENVRSVPLSRLNAFVLGIIEIFNKDKERVPELFVNNKRRIIAYLNAYKRRMEGAAAVSAETMADIDTILGLLTADSASAAGGGGRGGARRTRRRHRNRNQKKHRATRARRR